MNEQITFEIQKQYKNKYGTTHWVIDEYLPKANVAIRKVTADTIEDARTELFKALKRNARSLHPAIDFRIVKKVVSYEVVA